MSDLFLFDLDDRYNEIDDIFSEFGAISCAKKDYEKRDGQVAMSKLVYESLNNNEIAVIEAGTGIGKSFAYLVPAFLYAEKTEERIVISTHTINLQNQLINKDILFIKEILNSNINPILVKGRRNYLCNLKLYNLQSELMFETNKELLDIDKWSKNTETGDIEELTFVPSDDIWDKVCSDKDFCLGRGCSFYKSCFVQRARKKIEESKILIVNHHILFSDIEMKSKNINFLPFYDKIIIDEAHNIEKSASSFFSYHFSKSGFYKFFSFYKSKSGLGLIPRLLYKMSKDSKDIVLSDVYSFIDDKVISVFNEMFSNSFNVFDKIRGYLHFILNSVEYYDVNKGIQYRVKYDEWYSEEFNENFIKPLFELTNNIKEFLKIFGTMISMFNERVEGIDNEIKKKYEMDLKLLKGYYNKLKSYYENIIFLLQVNPDDYVIWFDIFSKKEDPLFTFNVAPIKIDLLLKEKVFDVFSSVIMTSATITVNNKFDYFFNMTGLSYVLKEGRNIIYDSFESPFNYKDQVLFVCPDDIPDVVENSEEYNEKLNDFLKKTILSVGGSTFVLFTSYEQLKKSYNEVGPFLFDNGLKSYYQGGLNNQKMLELFKDDISSSLFGTDSFWEGVDAPGDTLRYVVLAKLPFRMPTNPIEEARVEYYKRKGLNPFMELSLPQAVIRFKQGFGRLIRTKNDYGVVALLDRRILYKSYSSVFINSIPKCTYFVGSCDEVANEISKYIKNKESMKK